MSIRAGISQIRYASPRKRSVELGEGRARRKVLERIEAGRGKVDLTRADVIVDINNDLNSPISNVANYGIVGDLFDLVPALTKSLKEEKAN